ncbi:MAG: hypothetical protein OdinLCB4_001705 [Candidatus Odinarchaeum yellowstonii]|uniref:Uncharacterized protein n=1 Tax=Odinarchaeota yellowstonii (strain LCB_4) TaxID=1841599 RepID=A0AAF0D2Z4_ODILC|nr:MAG: hypothetical protein OdinLCB4_001705 [Candidatus Odinarchaeum yellowstonii]
MSGEGSDNKPSKLSRIAAIIIGLIMAAGAAYLMYLGIATNNFLYIIMGFLLFSFVTSLLNIGARPVPSLMKPVNTMTVIKCDKCGFSEIREFRRGDYIFKELGKCKDCDGTAYIKSIYTIEEEKGKRL